MGSPSLDQITMASVARAMPLGFAVYASRGRWKPARHLEFLNNRLLDITAGKVRNIIVSAPPRHGKSELISHYFPAWFLGNYPERNVIMASYGSTLAWSWGRKARDTLAYHGPSLWGVGVRRDYAASGAWSTTKGGVMFSTGVDGPATGRGADLLIIDDPVKDQQEARSKAIQQRNWDWYRSVASTRLSPKGVQVLVMTRWTENDLAGKILEDDDLGEWVEIRLPALAEENDPLGRQPGEALWEERFPVKILEERRTRVGPSWWNAMYQGKPGPDEGTLFKRQWFRYWHQDGMHYVLEEPHGPHRIEVDQCHKRTYCDMAATEGEQNSYTVMLTVAITPFNDILVLDMARERAETTKHKALVDSVRARHDTDFRVEEKTFGLSLIQELKNTGIPISGVPADRDKVARARFAEARYSLGKVYHPVKMDWLPTLEDELLAFPNGEFNDIVDTVAYATIDLATQDTAEALRGSRRRR